PPPPRPTRFPYTTLFRSEQLQAEREVLAATRRLLEESRRQYADMYDFAPVGHVRTDRNGLIHEANLAAASLLGIDRLRLVGMPLLVCVHNEDRPLLLRHLQRCRHNIATVQTELRLKSRQGGAVPVQLLSRPATVAAGQPPSFRTALIDLTDRVRAEEELRQVNADLQRVMREQLAAEAASDA